MPAALITTAQRSMSDLSMRARYSGVAVSAVAGTAPSSSMRARTAGSATAACSASDSFATTGFGVPLGAKTAAHPWSRNCSRPASLDVGTLGVTGDEISYRRALAAIGDRVEIETGEVREKQVGQVIGRADSGMSIGDLAWIGLRLRGELLERLGREVVA